MNPFHKILAACDLSPYTHQILAHAVAVAESTGAKLILANVVNQRDVEAIEQAMHRSYGSPAEGGAVAAIIRDTKAEREARLKAFIADSGRPDLFSKVIVTIGVPFKALNDIVVAERIDVVVMGTRGRTNLHSILLGSTAEKMFRHCPVPILSVRLPKDVA